MLQIPELLAPAGDAERLRYAINYGADAVYCGLPEFGMRSAPANFTPEQLTESVIYAHARGRKVYLTMNTLPTNEEADRLPEAIKEAAKAGVDAFIVADLGVLDACKTFAPDIDVHLSTQTGITNWAAARAAYKMGAKRVVLAREMTLQDIAILRDKTPPELEIEAFVHGAMCMSVSGRCLLSNYMAGRDANRGQCAQPCRWKYYLSEETRPGQLYEIGENENGSYILNANDLCTAPFIDLICKAGVDSLKIEGRAKTFYYVASVTVAYRKALDAYLADPLCNFLPTIGMYGDIFRGLEFLSTPSNLRKMDSFVPVYLFSGDRDPVGEMGDGVKQVYSILRYNGVREVTLKLYPGGRHEMLNEANKAEVYADVLAWLEEHLIKKPLPDYVEQGERRGSIASI